MLKQTVSNGIGIVFMVSPLVRGTSRNRGATNVSPGKSRKMHRERDFGPRRPGLAGQIVRFADRPLNKSYGARRLVAGLTARCGCSVCAGPCQPGRLHGLCGGTEETPPICRPRF